MVRVTRHGMRRIRERVGINKKAVERHVLNVLNKGTPADRTKGSIRHWLENRKRRNRLVGPPGAAEQMEYWVYGDKTYVFARSSECMSLITCLQIPSGIVHRSNGQKN